MIAQVLAALLGTFSFAYVFHTPYRLCWVSALVGGCGWISYLLFTHNGISATLSCLGASFLLTIVARFSSAVLREPLPIFLIPGIFPLVPGAGIYYTAYYLMLNDLDMATIKGIETFKVAGAIVLGIVFASAFPQVWFNRLGSFFRKHLPHLN